MNNLSLLEEKLGVHFKNINLLKEALTHRSYLNEEPAVKNSNERLEFLGDSVLQLLSSAEIYDRFPGFPEGKLTNLRSGLVRTTTLGKTAADLSLGEFLFMSRGEEQGGGRQNDSLLADTFEAILGGIYLDQGLDKAREFLKRTLFVNIDNFAKIDVLYDFKSRLQEVVQKKQKVAPVYQTVSQEGPDHDKTFTVAVSMGRKRLATGAGKSKQEAQQEAARIALELLKR